MMKALLVIFVCIVLASCQEKKKSTSDFPKLGPFEVTIDGDTIFHQIVDFKLTNHLGEEVTLEKVKGKTHVAEFFFSRCPAICPRMKTQMIRIQEEFKNEENFHILSFTVDPKNDTVQKLKSYAEHLGVLDSKWDLLTGSSFQLQNVASRGYLQAAIEDSLSLNHSQSFVLIDEDLHIRGVYDGIDSMQVNQLINDIELFLK